MDVDIQNIPAVLVSYENNEYSQKAAAKAYRTNQNKRTPSCID
jgi:hypothetical protein